VSYHAELQCGRSAPIPTSSATLPRPSMPLAFLLRAVQSSRRQPKQGLYLSGTRRNWHYVRLSYAITMRFGALNRHDFSINARTRRAGTLDRSTRRPMNIFPLRQISSYASGCSAATDFASWSSRNTRLAKRESGGLKRSAHLQCRCRRLMINRVGRGEAPPWHPPQRSRSCMDSPAS
jgi:hypothetical protein